MIDLSSLNENQRQAVLWQGGPLLVLAGPGSGKTRVLTYRIARLLDESRGQHFRILALTFTNKAAAEMRNRVEQLIPSELERVRLTTFHSYAAELLRQHGSHINRRPDFQLLTTDEDRIALLEDAIFHWQRNRSAVLAAPFNPSQLLPVINRLLEACIAVEQAEQHLQQLRVTNSSLIAQVYAAYRGALVRTNTMDFPSLIAETLELLHKAPFIAKLIRKVYKHILVDEFQDTNQPQYKLLARIVEPDPSTLFVVADDDQIIYQWNGASPERLRDLRKDFKVSEIQLPENYRCPQPVIELANALIANNLQRSIGKKPLQAVKPAAGDQVIRVRTFDTLDEEVAWVAQDIAQRPASERCECAILARTKKLLEIAGKKLEESGIPVYYTARKNEFISAPLRMLHAILRLVNSKEDRQSLTRLSKAFFELEGVWIEPAQVIARASANSADLLRVWIDEVKLRDALNPQTRRLLEKDILPLLNNLDYRYFAPKLFEWADSYQHATRPDETAFNEFADEREVWNLLVTDINYKFAGEPISLFQFLQELDLVSKAPPKPPDAIPCFTIHASKGMEFGHVYLIGLVEDQLPSWNAINKGDHSPEMQEERRNCFVAITRTQQSLTLTLAKKVFGWLKKPSRFLAEMGIIV